MRVVSVQEIKDNDYNLNIGRYIDTTEPEPLVDVKRVRLNIKELEKREADIDKKLQAYLLELDL